MLRRRISKAVVVLALALACGTSAHAESSLDAVRARGRIRVGVKTDAAPFGFIDARGHPVGFEVDLARFFARVLFDDEGRARLVPVTDRKSTRLNSSHTVISYAVFCLKKKNCGEVGLTMLSIFSVDVERRREN